MARSQTPQGSLRQRNVGSKKADSNDLHPEVELDKVVKAAQQKASAGGERDHSIALFFTTVLAFVTRFWGISHPNEVVFDEVHFGKVRSETMQFNTCILLIRHITVCLLLPRTNVLLRCSSPFCQASLRLHGLARRI